MNLIFECQVANAASISTSWFAQGVLIRVKFKFYATVLQDKKVPHLPFVLFLFFVIFEV